MAMLPGNTGQVLARLMRATCATVVRAAAALSVGGARVWLQRLPLMVCFVGGVGAMWASVWVRANADRHRGTGQTILAVAVANLLAAIGLSGFDPQIALNIFDAMV